MRTRSRRSALRRLGVVALLGLARPTLPRERRPARTAAVVEQPADDAGLLQRGRAAQLPPFGRGNGLDALFWTVLARLTAEQADGALALLAACDVPAYATVAPPLRHTDPRAAGAPHDLWVASLQVDAAQDSLMALRR